MSRLRLGVDPVTWVLRVSEEVVEMFGLFQSEGRVPKGAPDPSQPHQLALYRSATCGFCWRVEKALQDLDVEVELRDVNAGDHRRVLRETTGRSTVPCLFIDGQPLFESLDIIAWLKAHDAALKA